MKLQRISQSTGKPICGCGQGYQSAYDGKCGQPGCRNKRERDAHKRMIR